MSEVLIESLLAFLQDGHIPICTKPYHIQLTSHIQSLVKKLWFIYGEGMNSTTFKCS